MKFQSVLLVLFIVTGLAGMRVSAATITVNSLSDAVGNNGACTLREAITNANANNQSGSTDCTAGQPNATAIDVINIDAVGTISMTSATLITISASLTINGNNQTISHNDTGNRIFSITAGTVVVNNLTMRDGLRGGSGIVNGGGCLLIGTATVTLNNNVITSCAAAQGGGGITNNGGTLTLINSTVSGNAQTSTTISGGGGGIQHNSGTLNMTNSTVSGNTAALFGGGLVSNAGTVNILRSTISGNTASASDPTGGGIDNSSTLYLVNSTISGNIAANPVGGHGGGYFNFSGQTFFVNSTITANTSAGPNGGAGVRSDAGAVMVRNTIIADNNAASSNVYGSFSSQGYNLIGLTVNEGCCFFEAGDQFDVSANLGSLSSNGGPTQTHALLPGSSAIDRGSNALATNPISGGAELTFDQRNFARIIDSDGNGSAIVDIGAYEVQVTTAAVVSVSGRVVAPQNLGLTNALVTLTDSQGNSQTTMTGKFGSFNFRDVEAGETYILTVSSKRYTYAPQIISPTESLAEITFTPQ